MTYEEEVAKNRAARVRIPEDEDDFPEDEVDEEDEDDEEKTPKKIDFTDWEEANPEDLQILRVRREAEKVLVPLDFENKKYITLFITELPIEDQLTLMEEFITFDSKTNEAKIKFLAYYRKAWRRMVRHSQPKITWNRAKNYGTKFTSILFNYLPNPFEALGEGPGGISEKEEKN